MRENAGKKENWGNVLILPARVCEAGYGPGFQKNMRTSLEINDGVNLENKS